MQDDTKPVTIVYPLPATIESDETEIPLTDELKLVKFSAEELKTHWGAHVEVTKEGEATTRRVIVSDATATFHSFIPGLGQLATQVLEWQWWLIYAPEKDDFTSDTQTYAQACIRICSNLLVEFPFSFVFTAHFSSWHFNSVSSDKLSVLSFDYMDKLAEVNTENLKKIIGEIDDDKLETSERLSFAVRSFHRRFSTDAYVSELVCVLERLYGAQQDSKYKFNVHIFTGNGDLSSEENWNLFDKAYKLRSTYLHGKKVDPAKKFEEADIIKLEARVSTLLQRFFETSLSDIQKSYTDTVLVSRLKT